MIQSVNRNNKTGFTLVEIIISLALFAIILISVLTGMQFAYNTLSASGTYMEENYNKQLNLEGYVGTSVTENSDSISIAWSNLSDVEDFTISGKIMFENSSSLHLSETFEVFRPLTISPSH